MPGISSMVGTTDAARLRCKVGAVVLVALASVSLAGCGKGSKGNSSASGSQTVDTSELSTDTAASMLLTYAIQNCRMDQYQYDAAAALPIVDAWEHMLPSKGYAVQSIGSTGGAFGVDVYTYGYQGVTMSIKVTIFPMFGGSRSVAACLWVPKSVTVLDTTIDPTGKTAAVVFRYDAKVFTPFARDMYALSPTPSSDEQADELSANWTAEHTAYFQKLDATGWRVDSIR
jgi:hypothetical protein